MGNKKKISGGLFSFSPVFAAMLLKAAAAWRVFIYPSARLLWGSARRAPVLPPPVCLVLHMLGTGHSQHVHHIQEHQSYCVPELLHIPRLCQHPGLASTKQVVCTIWFLNQSRAGWNLGGLCCHCPKSLGKGVLGTLLLDLPPWGAAQSPSAGHSTLSAGHFTLSAGHSAPSLFCFTACEEKKVLHWKRKKTRLRSWGHFNKHLT